MNAALESPDLDVTATQRQVAALDDQTFQQFQSLRTLAGVSDAAFSFGVRASRPASAAAGDRYFATDRNCLFYYSGVVWAVVAGIFFGTNATRGGMTVDATDNGFFFITNDQNKVWVVTGGAWVDLATTLDLGTSLKVAGTKVIGAQEAGWTAATGTPNKGAYATYAGQSVSAAYVQAEAQQTDDKVKADSQRIKAIEDALRSHGLIN